MQGRALELSFFSSKGNTCFFHSFLLTPLYFFTIVELKISNSMDMKLKLDEAL